MTQACAAGVDVGRDYFDVGLAPSGRFFRTGTGARDIETVVTRLRREGAGKVVLESIGGYGARLVRALAEAGFEVGVVDPKRIRALRLAEGRRAKTDRLDAALIARFALIMQDAAHPVPSAKAFEIRPCRPVDASWSRWPRWRRSVSSRPSTRLSPTAAAE